MEEINLVLEHLKAIRATLNRIVRDNEEFKARFLPVESDGQYHKLAIINLQDRVERLERRLALVD